MKERLKNAGFWVSLAAAVVLILQAFGVNVDAPAVNEIIGAVCSVLVMLGILSNPKEGTGYFDCNKQAEVEKQISEVEENSENVSADDK